MWWMCEMEFLVNFDTIEEYIEWMNIKNQIETF